MLKLDKVKLIVKINTCANQHRYKLNKQSWIFCGLYSQVIYVRV